MNKFCGCCASSEQLPPLPLFNRPGMAALAYRVGTHASFLETMLARLSSLALSGVDAQGNKTEEIYPLKGLTTRDPADPSIALLDAWAMVADVLTFYQERIANEGYLRTALERRSILELARMVGYTLRPGLAASVYLAYTLEKDQNTTLLVGNRAQSLPGPGELPQSFETAEKLEARFAWNVLRPLLSRQQFLMLDLSQKVITIIDTDTVYFQGTATRLKPGDPLLFLTEEERQTIPVGHPASITHGAVQQVATVEAQPAQDRTKIVLQLSSSTNLPAPQGTGSGNGHIRPGDVVESLLKPPVPQMVEIQSLHRNITQIFAPQSAIQSQLLKIINPALADTLDEALSSIAISPARSPAPGAVSTVQAFRVKAALFGHNVSSQFLSSPVTAQNLQTRVKSLKNNAYLLPLDAYYDQIATGSRVVLTLANMQDADAPSTCIMRKVMNVQTITLSPLDVLGWTQVDGKPDLSVLATATKITLLTLDEPWLSDLLPQGQSGAQGIDLLPLLRGATIYAQSENLSLADIPLAGNSGDGQQLSPASTIQGSVIELDQLYPDLKSGRWIIVSGERTDIQGARGVVASELAMLASATEEVHKITASGNEPAEGDNPNSLIDLPGGKLHTFLYLARPLAYTYKRDTVTIYGNVVRATHGETHSEVLGSGNGSKPLQQFSLRQAPLTYLSAPTSTGSENTLQTRVNDILWHEIDSLVHTGPTDHSYTTHTDDTGKTSIIFGNGERGARLPTGVENVTAIYRTGIGKAGNVNAGQISLLATRPLGVKSVINPLPATGGADGEIRDQARGNVPLGVMSEERLVSIQDYADFACVFAGIGKASAVRISDGHRRPIHISIAGVDNIPLDDTSDLYRNLLLALHRFGDPHVPLQLAICEVVLLVINAEIHLLPDYLWKPVEASIRGALLEAFSFERRQLGQPVFQSEVISVIQGVPGVAYVDLRRLDALNQAKLVAALNAAYAPATEEQEVFAALIAPLPHDIVVNLARPDPLHPATLLPAQLAFLSPDQPDTLILSIFGAT